MVIGFYEAPNQPKAVKIPEGKESAVDSALSAHKGITIGGKHYRDEQIIGIFEEQEWTNLRDTLLKPEPKTMDDLRNEEWYIKSKRGK